jgi:O-acetyl-ADP-ribose deacetylase (regulator of RNase III)/transcriptional regulator with XRE-family HTH domain
MSFHIIQHDLLQMKTDVIVNPTDIYYSGGGGVDYQIHKAAGSELFEACGFLGRLHAGKVKVTKGYGLPVPFIFHTSGPRWKGGHHNEPLLLADCYKNSIKLAREKHCESIAFPLIASQGKHFPKELALTVAIDTIREELCEDDDLEVYLVVYGKPMQSLSEHLFPDIQQIIEQDYKPSPTYYAEHLIPVASSADTMQETESTLHEGSLSLPKYMIESENDSTPDFADLLQELMDKPTQKNLDKFHIEESFAQMLARLLKERALKQSSVYDELGMTNVGFWKLLKGKSNPSKMTVFALAIALQLSIEETEEMLMKAGYAINPSSLQDVIIAGLIRTHNYDRYAMDGLLYALDLQPLPGAIID